MTEEISQKIISEENENNLCPMCSKRAKCPTAIFLISKKYIAMNFLKTKILKPNGNDMDGLLEQE